MCNKNNGEAEGSTVTRAGSYRALQNLAHADVEKSRQSMPGPHSHARAVCSFLTPVQTCVESGQAHGSCWLADSDHIVALIIVTCSPAIIRQSERAIRSTACQTAVVGGLTTLLSERPNDGWALLRTSVRREQRTGRLV